MAPNILTRHRAVYLVALLWILGAAVACESPPVGDDPLQTANLARSATVDDAQPVGGDQTLLYWRDGDLWRSKTDGSDREQLTQGRYFDQWVAGPGDDPWWIGGPPPQPFISPDGRWLVASVDGKKFAVVDLSGVEPPRLFPTTATFFSWSPDSRTIAYGRDKINIFDVAAGELLEGDERRPGDVADIVWSPDGQEIAFACCFRPDDQQSGTEIGDIYRYHLANAAAERAGETWRSVASHPPGLCWVDGLPIPADETDDRSQCSPEHLLPQAESADGLWKAELSEYSPEKNVFTVLRVTARADDHERLRLDLSGYEPALDLRRIFWTQDGEALLLGSYWLGEAIYRLDLGEGGELTPIVEDGLLLGLIP